MIEEIQKEILSHKDDEEAKKVLRILDIEIDMISINKVIEILDKYNNEIYSKDDLKNEISLIACGYSLGHFDENKAVELVNKAHEKYDNEPDYKSLYEMLKIDLEQIYKNQIDYQKMWEELKAKHQKVNQEEIETFSKMLSSCLAEVTLNLMQEIEKKHGIEGDK